VSSCTIAFSAAMSRASPSLASGADQCRLTRVLSSCCR
jgi:hypothetical protein